MTFPAWNDLPGYVRMEMKVATILEEQHCTGWQVDVDKLRKNIDILKVLMAKLEEKIVPNLPYVVKNLETSRDKVDGTFAGIKKPFMKSGKWSKSVEKVFPEFEQYKPYGDPSTAHCCVWKGKHDLYPFSIGGPFCRVEFNKVSLSSDEQVKNYLMSVGWQPLEWNYSKQTGKVTSPKLTEESMDASRHRLGKTGLWITQHLKAQHRLGQMSGWLANVAADGRLYATVDGQGASTGRMTHKLIANVPSVEKKSFYAKKMREVFIAKPGYVLVSADSASDQIRKLCHYLGGQGEITYAVLHGQKKDGTDLHTLNKNKAGLKTRGHAKNFFYGAILFGAGDAKTAKLLDIRDPKEAKKVKENYFKELPELAQLKEGLRKAWKKRGFLYAIDGRKLFVRKENDLLVYCLQSAEAITMKWAMCQLYDWIKAEGLDSRQVMIYHDEYTHESHPSVAERVGFLQVEAIRAAGRFFKLNVPADGEYKIGHNWKEVH